MPSTQRLNHFLKLYTLFPCFPHIIQISCTNLLVQILSYITGCNICSFSKQWHLISLTQVITAWTQLTHNSPAGNTNSQNRSHTNQSLRVRSLVLDQWMHRVLSLCAKCFCFHWMILVNTWKRFNCILCSLHINCIFLQYIYFFTEFQFILLQYVEEFKFY